MTKKKQRLVLSKISLAVALCFLANGCAVDPKTGQPSFKQTFNNDDPCSNNARNIGIAVGAIAGAVIAHQLDKHSGKFVGAGAGALIGGLIGADMDMRRCELSKVAKQYNLDIAFATVDSRGVTIEDAALKDNRQAEEIKKNAIGSVVAIRDHTPEGGHFESGSDRLTPRAQDYFTAIAQSYNARIMADKIKNQQEKENYLRHMAKRKLLLVGHTDDTGSSRLNADLSERRARAVAKFLSQQGIPLDSLYFQGAGESYPIADNSTDAGHAQNRRVEFVELADDATLRKYLEARRPKYEYYRSVERTASSDAGVSPAPAKSKDKKASPAPDSSKVAVTPPAKSAQAKPKNVKVASTAKEATSVRQAPTVGTTADAANPSAIDFGGTRLTDTLAVPELGKLEQKKSWFSMISPAYANEPAVLRDCSQDRPRISGAVKALRDGKQYDTSEHLPGLYGKSWTEKINGHQVIINKVAVLRNDAAVSLLPEFKVYANYRPEINRNPTPDVTATPDVNTYLGSNGLLYRMFMNGKGGIQCVDVLFSGEGGATAKAGKLIYSHDSRTYVADFKPSKI
ncbi:OmpA family protein [Noviherbaspirillum saxi]|nr:OmpA family protein [Noviherbaspirillum saxi]